MRAPYARSYTRQSALHSHMHRSIARDRYFVPAHQRHTYTLTEPGVMTLCQSFRHIGVPIQLSGIDRRLEMESRILRCQTIRLQAPDLESLEVARVEPRVELRGTRSRSGGTSRDSKSLEWDFEGLGKLMHRMHRRRAAPPPAAHNGRV